MSVFVLSLSEDSCTLSCGSAFDLYGLTSVCGSAFQQLLHETRSVFETPKTTLFVQIARVAVSLSLYRIFKTQYHIQLTLYKPALFGTKGIQ